MGHLKNFIRFLLPNPFIQVLKKLKTQPKIALFWNRGLGDIPLELYPLICLIKRYTQGATITIITREDLYQGFLLLEGVQVLYTPQLIRKQQEPYEAIFKQLNLDPHCFDHIVYKPDPAFWAKEEKKRVSPELIWQERFYQPINLTTSKPIAVLHIHSETHYDFEKNLPKTSWDLIIQDLKSKGYYTLAVGFKKTHLFDVDYDLRGQTCLHQLISLMLDYEPLFIGPDSGLLNIFYFLKVKKPWHLISFWSNPHVGLLNYKSASPNCLLTHTPFLAPYEDLKKLDLTTVVNCIADANFIQHVYLKKTPLSLVENQTLKLEIATAHRKLSQLTLAQKLPILSQDNPPVTPFKPSCHDFRLMPIILAGGQGTRLGHHQPKALYPVLGKSLISYFLAQLKKASEQAHNPLKACLMVSAQGYQPIVDHLKEHHYFGLEPTQLIILIQTDLPFYTQDHQLVLKNDKKLHEGPCGNGEVFKLLKHYNVFETLDPAIIGFEIVPIDNPLAPLFCANHSASFDEGYEASIIALETQGDKTLGKLAVVKEKICIIEYTDHPNDHLSYANTGLLAFNLSLAKRLSTIEQLNYHTAPKNYACFTGKVYENLNVTKLESFIFDHLVEANKVAIHLGPAQIFQPLKTLQGPYGIEALENSLGLQDFKLC